MIENSNASERFDTALVTWIAASYHSAMPTELRVSAQMKEQTYSRVGKLLDRLLTDACVDQARMTLKSEGEQGLASALHRFWSSGVTELNESKEATSTFSEVWGYADSKKISDTLRPPQ
ncbi:hypothetical protein OPU71_21015 [Niveibacterium sp. 24ML]|uniref:hypothetical protein n=1 Tax=Niveibacterium sp. 24ML TaxID=2985512 RepID=UPI00226EE78B|nr:hypothetical protein [Niveibacterium sp. 24ML]MCX9158602.1 hypothetical protein [Niveibacterium sp. 24ML]